MINHLSGFSPNDWVGTERWWNSLPAGPHTPLWSLTHLHRPAASISIKTQSPWKLRERRCRTHRGDQSSPVWGCGFTGNPAVGPHHCLDSSPALRTVKASHTHTHTLLNPLNSEWPRLGSNKRVGFTSGTRAEGGGQSTLVDLCTVYLH